MTPTVALSLPIRPGFPVDPETYARGAAAIASPSTPTMTGVCCTSLLPYTFNTLWAGFLEMRKDGLTRFAMIHDDVRPQSGWLDVLLAELDATGADVVAAVVPIKDRRGLTSTALDDTGDEWNPRRLTMTEVFEKPETFTDPAILLNTGLWVCRFDRPWCEKVSFRQTDRIVRLDDGRYAPQTRPEDWDFSRQVRALGGTLYATRKVVLEHERAEYTTARPWGTLVTDVDAGNSCGVHVTPLR